MALEDTTKSCVSVFNRRSPDGSKTVQGRSSLNDFFRSQQPLNTKTTRPLFPQPALTQSAGWSGAFWLPNLVLAPPTPTQNRGNGRGSFEMVHTIVEALVPPLFVLLKSPVEADARSVVGSRPRGLYTADCPPPCYEANKFSLPRQA